jgi:hypothetical protein
MKAILLIVFVLACFLFLFSSLPHNAYACSCGGNHDFLLTWTGSTGAFQANVTKIEENGNNQKVYFDISSTQKGFYSGEYALEQSTFSTCTVHYNIGETYQVFLWPNESGILETDICSSKQITGFDEYSYEGEDGQMQHYREDYNILTQYSLLSMIIPVSVAMIIPSFIVWRIRK